MCSCDNMAAHVIAHRRTTDGVYVALWSDGAVTGVLGRALPGVGIARPRSRASVSTAVAAGWLLLGELETYEVNELPGLYAACRWVAARGGCSGDVRARIAAINRPSLAPVWTVLSTDRDGRPTERFWRLPRLRWPSLAVWDYMHNARGGRYELMGYIDRRRESCAPTGIRFSTLAELAAHLANEDVEHKGAVES